MNKKLNDLNERIIRYRRFAGYTQETAAQALGMKKSTYANMERNGKPSPDLILKISMLFNVSVSTLFYGEQDTSKNSTPVSSGDMPIRLNEPVILPEAEPPLILTANEKSIVKALKSFSKEDFERVRDFVNEIYQKNKKA